MRSASRIVASRWAMTRPVRPSSSFERLLDQHFGIAVDIGRGLVEHQDLGIGHQRPREAEQLALAERKVAAALSEHGCHSHRQRA